MIEQLAREGHAVIGRHQIEMSRVYETRGIRTKIYAKIDRKDGVPWTVSLTYESGPISKEVSKQIDELTEKFNKSIGKKQFAGQTYLGSMSTVMENLQCKLIV